MVESSSNLANPTRILARTMYRRLVSEGYDERQIVAFASEIIGMVTESFRERGDEPPLSRSPT
jgi:hypothetical protein